MKKILITVASLTLVLVMGAMLAACSPNAEGTYEIVSMAYYVNGELEEEMKEGVEGFEEHKDDYKLVFNKDGTCDLGRSKAKWEQNGKEITITDADDNVIKGTLSGKTLTITTEEGEYKSVMTFKKV